MGAKLLKTYFQNKGWIISLKILKKLQILKSNSNSTVTRSLFLFMLFYPNHESRDFSSSENSLTKPPKNFSEELKQSPLNI